MSRKKTKRACEWGVHRKWPCGLFSFMLCCVISTISNIRMIIEEEGSEMVLCMIKNLLNKFLWCFFFVVGSLGSVDRVFLRLSEDLEARETVHSYHLKVWTIMRRQMTTMKSRVKPPQQREWWVWDQQPPRNLINGSGWRFLSFFFSARKRVFLSSNLCRKKANNSQTIFTLLFWRYLEVVKLIL